MRKSILDTSVLIHYWRTHIKEQGLERATPADAEQWAQDLARLHRANAIATPVVIELLAGTKNSHELTLARAFLAQFHVADAGDVRAADWGESRRLAERVPRQGHCQAAEVRCANLRSALSRLTQGHELPLPPIVATKTWKGRADES